MPTEQFFSPATGPPTPSPYPSNQDQKTPPKQTHHRATVPSPHRSRISTLNTGDEEGLLLLGLEVELSGLLQPHVLIS